MSNQATFASEISTFPRRWDVAFPQDKKTLFSTYQSESDQQIGVVVRQYSAHEARFILRGEIKLAEDLVTCLKLAERNARQLGCNVLTTQERVHPEWCDALTVFQRQGFEAVDESWVFKGSFKSFADRIQRIAFILSHKNAIPQDARVSSLTEGQDQVRALLNESLMMDDFEFDNRLKSTASKPISASYSQIAWYGQQIVGVLLVAPTVDSGVYDIPIRYVLPDYRQTWVNALLIAASVKHGENLGAQFIQFEANLKLHPETLMLAEKTGCKCIAVFNRFEKPLF